MEYNVWSDYHQLNSNEPSSQSVLSTEVVMAAQFSGRTQDEAEVLLATTLSRKLAEDLQGLNHTTRTRFLQYLIQLGLAINADAEHLREFTNEWVSDTLYNRLSNPDIKTLSLLQLDVLRRVLVYAGGPAGNPLSKSRAPVLEADRHMTKEALIGLLELGCSPVNDFVSLETVAPLLRNSEACKDSDISDDLIRQRHNDLACSLGLESERLQLYKAASESNVFILFFRGGAFRGDKETGSTKDSYEPARLANKFGFHAYILSRYACIQDQPGPLLDSPFSDVKKAIQTIRRRHPGSCLGLCGFSAGGLMASILNSLADFIVLAYAVTSQEDDIAHKESRENLLGLQPSKEQISKFSAATHVNQKTCPAYIFHSIKDESVSFKHTLRLAQAYIDAHRPFKLVLVPRGLHGAHGIGDLVGLPEFLQDIMKPCSLRVTKEIDFSEMDFTGQETVMVQNYEVFD